MFKAYKYHLKFILFSILIYLLNPIVTEFAHFGGAFLGMQKVNTDNTLLYQYGKEFSSQIIISSSLTILFKSPLIVESIGGLINVILATTAVYQLVRLFDEAFQVQKKNQRIFLVIIIIFILEFSLNTSYRLKFPISYSIFGNSGMWFSIMVLGMILRKKVLGYLFLGILISWHFIWALFTFIPILLTKDLFYSKKISLKKILLAFLLGLTISISFYIFFYLTKSKTILSFDLLSLIKPVIINKSQLSSHHIELFDYISYLKIIIIISFGLYLLENLKKIKKKIDLNFYKKLFIIFGATGFVLTLYLSLASFVTLIGSEILIRMIPNRIFNTLIVLNTVLVVYISLLIIENKKINNLNYFTKIIIIVWLILVHQITGILVALVFTFMVALKNFKIFQKLNTSPKRKIIFLFSIMFLFFAKIIIFNRHFYTIYDYLFEKNNIIKEFKLLDPNSSLVLLGPGIPAAHAFSIYLAQPVEFLVHGHDIGKALDSINTITGCKKTRVDNGFKYYLDWSCMANVTKLSWEKINLQISITHVLAKNDSLPLQLPIIAKSNHFTLYNLK
jgi:hypothetical protein